MTTTTNTEATFAEVITMMTEQIEWNKKEVLKREVKQNYSWLDDKIIGELLADTRRIENNIWHMKQGRELA